MRFWSEPRPLKCERAIYKVKVKNRHHPAFAAYWHRSRNAGHLPSLAPHPLQENKPAAAYGYAPIKLSRDTGGHSNGEEHNSDDEA